MGWSLDGAGGGHTSVSHHGSCAQDLRSITSNSWRSAETTPQQLGRAEPASRSALLAQRQRRSDAATQTHLSLETCGPDARFFVHRKTGLISSHPPTPECLTQSRPSSTGQTATGITPWCMLGRERTTSRMTSRFAIIEYPRERVLGTCVRPGAAEPDGEPAEVACLLACLVSAGRECEWT